MGLSGILLVASIICFVLQALGVQLGKFSIGWLGMALFAGSFLA